MVAWQSFGSRRCRAFTGRAQPSRRGNPKHAMQREGECESGDAIAGDPTGDEAVAGADQQSCLRIRQAPPLQSQVEELASRVPERPRLVLVRHAVPLLPLGRPVNRQDVQDGGHVLPFVSEAMANPARKAAPQPVAPAPTDFASRFRIACEHAGTTATAIERRLNLNRGDGSKIARGLRKQPGAPIVEAMADALGVDFHWLSTGRGTMLPPRTPPTRRRSGESGEY